MLRGSCQIGTSGIFVEQSHELRILPRRYTITIRLEKDHGKAAINAKLPVSGSGSEVASSI